MKAITLHQPWASLIACGAKPFETRSFPPPRKLIGQRIAIHGAKRPMRAAEIQALMKEVMSPGGPTRAAAFDVLARQLPLGAVVCTVTLTGAYRLGENRQAHWKGLLQGVAEVVEVMPGSRSIDSMVPIDPFGDYSPGRWIWRCEDVRRLAQPLPWTGKQGWFEVPDEMVGDVVHG